MRRRWRFTIRDPPCAGAAEVTDMSFPDPPVQAFILLVEDDPVQARIISDLLDEQGYAVNWKRLLAEGREVIRTEVVDLVLLDRILPDGDGCELCEELKQDPKTREFPVVLLTARDRVEDRVEGLLRGADDYIPKPFHEKELLARVHGCLRTLSLQRQLRRKAEELEEKNQVLVATQSRLVKSERLAAIGEIGLAIRHEINNPLGTILGYADLLLAHPEGLPSDVQHKLEAIRRASLRIRDVVRRLEGLREDRKVEYIPGVNMTDLRPQDPEAKGENRG